MIASRLPMPKGRVAIAPSILSADMAALGAAAKLAEKGGADWLHVDVMDGHFVPNLSFGPGVVSALRKRTALALDAHLMVDNPRIFIEPFAKAGADALTLHLEVLKTPALLKKIRALGMRAGISIKPDMPVARLRPWLAHVDLILMMTVYPGFGGQKFLPESPERISQARKLIKASGRKIWLQVDGGINAATVAQAVASGADSFVAGNAVYGAASPARAIALLRKSAESQGGRQCQ